MGIILMAPQSGGSGILSTIIMLGIMFTIVFFIVRLITRRGKTQRVRKVKRKNNTHSNL